MLELLATNNFGDTRDGSLAGPIGLVIILLLAVATFLLIRNMNQRLRRLPERFGDGLPSRTTEHGPSESEQTPTDGSTPDDAEK